MSAPYSNLVTLLLGEVLPNGRRALVMMKVYMDRAAREDSDQGVMCVAATVFRPVRYKQFVRQWNRMLRGWGASAFHATDFYPGGGEFARPTVIRVYDKGRARGLETADMVAWHWNKFYVDHLSATKPRDVGRILRHPSHQRRSNPSVLSDGGKTPVLSVA